MLSRGQQSIVLCTQAFEERTFGEHDDDDEGLVEADACADVDKADDVLAELGLHPHALGRALLPVRRVGREAHLGALRQLHLGNLALRVNNRDLYGGYVRVSAI